MAIVYRPIDPADTDQVRTFNLNCERSGRDANDWYAPDTDEERLAGTRQIIAQLTTDASKHHCLAAFENRSMIGVIRLEMQTIDKLAACHVRALWVHPDHRGHGVATRLKDRAETWARAQGSAFMDSNVRAGNERMIALNRKMGYEVTRLNFRKRLD